MLVFYPDNTRQRINLLALLGEHNIRFPLQAISDTLLHTVIPRPQVARLSRTYFRQDLLSSHCILVAIVGNDCLA